MTEEYGRDVDDYLNPSPQPRLLPARVEPNGLSVTELFLLLLLMLMVVPLGFLTLSLYRLLLVQGADSPSLRRHATTIRRPVATAVNETLSRSSQSDFLRDGNGPCYGSRSPSRGNGVAAKSSASNEQSTIDAAVGVTFSEESVRSESVRICR